jgi:hypothetical protein
MCSTGPVADAGTASGVQRSVVLGAARASSRLWRLLLVLPLAPFSFGCAPLVGTPLGIFEWESYEGRAATSPMPVAPPPMQADHMVDVSLRQIGATRTSGSEVEAHRETGMHPLRTDGGVSVRLADFFAFRALGSLGYGSPLGAPPAVSFPTGVSGNGGLGAVFGYWGDPAWSITLELEGMLTLVDSRDLYAARRGPCYSYDGFLGDYVRCFAETQLGRRSYQGIEIVPTLGATFDVAGSPVDWLRVGGGVSVQEFVSRNRVGAVHHEVVGIARVFVELHYGDVWVGFEAQQWVIEDAQLAPSLAITLGGVAFERAARPEDDVDDGDVDDRDVERPLRGPPRIPFRLRPDFVPPPAPISRPPRPPSRRRGHVGSESELPSLEGAAP